MAESTELELLRLRKRKLELEMDTASTPTPEPSLKDVVIGQLGKAIPKSPADLLPPLPTSMKQIPGASIATKGGRIVRDNPEGALEALPAAAGGVAGLAVAPLGPWASAAVAGGAGAVGELAKQYGRGKMGLPPVSPIAPKIPFTNKNLPPIPGIPERASRVIEEGALQAGPQLLGSAAVQLAEKAAPAAVKAGINLARRAQGFQKSQLASSKDWAESLRKMAQANRAAEEALKRGDMPLLGGADDMLEKSQKLLEEGSGKVKNALQSANQAKAAVPEAVVDDALLKTLDPKNADELTAALKIRGDVTDILKDGELVPEAVAELRRYWGRVGFRDKTVGTAAAEMYRKAWKASARLMEKMLGDVNPKILKAFKEGMRQEEMANTALKGITNRVVGEGGNIPLSLPAAGADLQRRAFSPMSRLFYGAGKALKGGKDFIKSVVSTGIGAGRNKKPNEKK